MATHRVLDRFSPDARAILGRAERESRERGHAFVTPEHILLALIAQAKVTSEGAAWCRGTDLQALARAAEHLLPRRETTGGDPALLSPRARRALELALGEAAREGGVPITPLHLACGLTRERESAASLLLKRVGITTGALRGEPEPPDSSFIERPKSGSCDSPPPSVTRRPRATGRFLNTLSAAGAAYLLWSLLVVLLVVVTADLPAIPRPETALFVSLLQSPGSRAHGWLVVATSLWTSMCVMVLLAALQRRTRRVWAGLAALLFVHSASAGAGIAFLLVYAFHLASAAPAAAQDIGAFLAVCVLHAALWIGMTREFFQAREAFGVAQRRGWSTMAGEGRWVLGITALLEALYLGTFEFRW